MASIKILITVKAYPTLSKKYEETVCTAGFTEEGKWIRIYPIPYRKLDFDNQYKKYDWIEWDLVRNQRDFRPESYRPIDITKIPEPISHIDTKNNWAERKKIVLNKVYDDLELLIAEAKDKSIITSLAVFKPTNVLDFISEPDEREWNKDNLEGFKQYNLFEEKGDNFTVIPKLPYKFSYIFEDKNGRQSKLMIEDWEIGALYWNSLAKHEGDEVKACEDVKNRFLYDLAYQRDLYFFLGTTRQFHLVAPNPFIIIGVFYPKKETKEPDLFSSIT